MNKQLVLLFLAIMAVFRLAAVPTNCSSVDSIICDNVTKSSMKVDYEEDGILVTHDMSQRIVEGINQSDKQKYIILDEFGYVLIGDSIYLPKKTDSFIIPFVCNPSVQIIQIDYHEIDISLNTISGIFSVTDFFNSEFCTQISPQKYRNYPVARVEICPFKIDKTRGKLLIADKIQYKLTYNVSSSNKIAIIEQESLLDPGCQITSAQAGITTYNGKEYTTLSHAKPGYLIISVPKFKNILETFVKWKKLLGFNVYEVYDSHWTPETIKESIKELYNDNPEIQYLLIVGDHSLVPGEVVDGNAENGNKPFITDFHYACMDGNDDQYADIYRGRWPIRKTYELEAIIEKSIRYEMEPNVNHKFYTSAAHFGYFQDQGNYTEDGHHKDGTYDQEPDGVEDRRFVRTCEDIRNFMLNNNLLLHIDRLYTANISKDGKFKNPSKWDKGTYCLTEEMPDDLKYENGFLWNANADSINKVLNEGRLYFLYRGHGFSDGWALIGNSQSNYNSIHIDKLSNIDALPLIFSFTCDTGDHRADENLVRSLLSHPFGGTHAVFAQTSTGISGKNDMLSSFFINSIWTEPRLSLEKFESDPFWQLPSNFFVPLPALRLGQMLDFAVNATSDNWNLMFPDSPLDSYVKQTTHCFGDPSILFRKHLPVPITDVLVSRNNNNGFVTVTLSENENKYISFYDKVTETSEVYKGADATYKSNIPGSERFVDVLVYDGNSIPYLDKGEYYDGENLSQEQTRLISHSLHSDGQYLSVNYYLSSAQKDRRVTLLVVDGETNNSIYSTDIDTSIYNVENTVNVYVNCGLMYISLMVDGYPYSTMKVFVPLN